MVGACTLLARAKERMTHLRRELTTLLRASDNLKHKRDVVLWMQKRDLLKRHDGYQW